MMGIPVLLMSAVLAAGYFGTICVSAKEQGIIGPKTEEVHPHEFPFLVVLKRDGRFLCGGTLIRKDVVLTAAHCVQSVDNPKRFSAELGRHSLLKDKYNRVQYMEVDKVEIHPFWNPYKVKNDIALVFLTKKADLNKYVQTMDSLSVFGQNEEIKESTRCYVIGYGLTDFGGELRYPEVPFKFNANIGKYQQCQKEIKKRIPSASMNPRKEVCVFEEDTSSACYGDSGSALFCDLEGDGQYVQYGIVSWGTFCQTATMFARVSYYNRWIKYKINEYRREKM